MNVRRFEILQQILSSKKIKVDLQSGKVFGVKGKEIGCLTSRGYLRTTITFKCGDYAFQIHEIIAIAGGLNIINLTINHINGNKLDNRFCNLEAVSQQDNQKHANINNFSHKRFGEYNKMAKLTLQQVNEIREVYAKGNVTFKDLAQKYKISSSRISAIIYGTAWNQGNKFLIKGKEVS